METNNAQELEKLRPFESDSWFSSDRSTLRHGDISSEVELSQYGYGIIYCPECQCEFEEKNRRVVVGSCKHIKCQNCDIESWDWEECIQCKNEADRQALRSIAITSPSPSSGSEFNFASSADDVVFNPTISSSSVELNTPIRECSTSTLTFRTNESKVSTKEPSSDSPSSSKACSTKSSDTDTQASTSTDNQAKTEGNGGREPLPVPAHISIFGEDTRKYQCNICRRMFKTKSHIRYHQSCLDGVKPFKCVHCDQKFMSKAHCEYHIRVHTGESPYECTVCKKKFNQQSKLTRHVRCHTGEKPYLCQQCGKRFSHLQSLKSHLLTHTGERPFTCKFCDKRFTERTNLKKHVATHTSTKERPFICPECGKSFGDKYGLASHIQIHSTERPFACKQCSQGFCSQKDLRRHLRTTTHSDEKPFECPICERRFNRKDNLLRHIKSTSSNNAPRFPKACLASKPPEATPLQSHLQVAKAGTHNKRLTTQKNFQIPATSTSEEPNPDIPPLPLNSTPAELESTAEVGCPMTSGALIAAKVPPSHLPKNQEKDSDLQEPSGQRGEFLGQVLPTVDEVDVEVVEMEFFGFSVPLALPNILHQRNGN